MLRMLLRFPKGIFDGAHHLGAIKTSVYIYAVPVVSVITATLLLGERLTGLALTGMALIILGLVISEGRLPLRRPKA